MHNVVLVAKTQALRRPSAVSVACEPKGERRGGATKVCESRLAQPVKRLADVVDCVRDRLERWVVESKRCLKQSTTSSLGRWASRLG